MKYQILVDYGSEGHNFEPEIFNTIKEAVEKATTKILYNPFKIVAIIDWINLIKE